MFKEEISPELLFVARQNINEKKYWLEKLSGDLSPGGFPRDYQKSTYQKRKAVENFRLTGKLLSRLIELSNGSDYRLHMILTTALIDCLTG